MEGTFTPKHHSSHHWSCHSSLTFLHLQHFPSCYNGSWCLELFSCLHLQPSLSSIPPFCLGRVPDLLPSFCLYLHQHLFLVSFPVLFRLEANLPSWPFSANSNASLNHTSARFFWNESSYHPNTNLLPWVLIHILITGQFQQTPVSDIKGIPFPYQAMQTSFKALLCLWPNSHLFYNSLYPFNNSEVISGLDIVTCDQNQAYCLSLDIKTMAH